jgi:Lipid A 3-O-deacylase (PagL)
VTRPGWSGRWSGRRVAAALVVVFHVMAVVAPAGAELRLAPGTMDLTLAGAYSVSHKGAGGDEVHTVNGFHLIPHFGYVVAEATERVQGSLELMLEPTLIHLDGSPSSTLGGVAGMVRWLFTGWPAAYPFLEAGAGILGGQAHLRQTNCDVNYILQAGVGGLIPLSDRTAVTVGYRFQHLSNNDQCSQNLGLNSSVLQIGFSYFFP